MSNSVENSPARFRELRRRAGTVGVSRRRVAIAKTAPYSNHMGCDSLCRIRRVPGSSILSQAPRKHDMSHFSVADYLVFGTYLVVSVAVGLLSAGRTKSLSRIHTFWRGEECTASLWPCRFWRLSSRGSVTWRSGRSLSSWIWIRIRGLGLLHRDTLHRDMDDAKILPIAFLYRLSFSRRTFFVTGTLVGFGLFIFRVACG